LQFEYQQAQLEAEIENLSWKVERADSYDRGVSVPLAWACWPDFVNIRLNNSVGELRQLSEGAEILDPKSHFSSSCWWMLWK